MPDGLLHTPYFWPVITQMGSAGVIVPTLAITAAGLWHARQRTAVHVWLVALALAVFITLASKIVFIGWGIGIASLDFTGVSGHTLLATAVLPVIFSWLLADERHLSRFAGATLGLLLATGVAVSRVVLGMHSISEVVCAWFIGLIVTWAALSTMQSPARAPWFARLSPLALLFAFGTTTSDYMPTHDWEIQLALLLSGHDKPYTRQHLSSPESME